MKESGVYSILERLLRTVYVTTEGNYTLYSHVVDASVFTDMKVELPLEYIQCVSKHRMVGLFDTNLCKVNQDTIPRA